MTWTLVFQISVLVIVALVATLVLWAMFNTPRQKAEDDQLHQRVSDLEHNTGSAMVGLESRVDGLEHEVAALKGEREASQYGPARQGES